MNWLSKQLGLVKTDPNRLMPFERFIYEKIYNFLSIHNTVFRSLVTQIGQWLEREPRPRISGIPNWWKRKITGNTLRCYQQLFAGFDYGLPAEMGERVCCFEFQILSNGKQSQVMVSFLLKQSVLEIVFKPIIPEMFSGRFNIIEIRSDDFFDERTFWQKKIEISPQYIHILTPLLYGLENPKHTDEPFVLGNPDSIEPVEIIADVKIPKSYSDFLSLTNGARINDLYIWGTDCSGLRCDKDWLYIGSGQGKLYGFEIKDGKATDMVVSILIQGGNCDSTALKFNEWLDVALETPFEPE